MMHVCGDCGAIWGTWLSACARCRGRLHTVGSDPADYDRPVLNRFPLARARVRVVADVAPVTMPRVRDSIDVWRAYAVATGSTAADVAALTKAELLDRYRPAPDPDDTDGDDAVRVP